MHSPTDVLRHSERSSERIHCASGMSKKGELCDFQRLADDKYVIYFMVSGVREHLCM